MIKPAESTINFQIRGLKLDQKFNEKYNNSLEKYYCYGVYPIELQIIMIDAKKQSY